MALTVDGQLFVWGGNDYGQLGFRIDKIITSPQCVELPAHLNIIDIVAGDYFSAFLTEQGEVYVCGNNENGSLGLGNAFIRWPSFTRVTEVIKDKRISQLKSGMTHMVAMSDDGEVFVWGTYGAKRRTSGKNFFSSNIPQKLPLQTEVISINCASEMIFILTKESKEYEVITYGEHEYFKNKMLPGLKGALIAEYLQQKKERTKSDFFAKTMNELPYTNISIHCFFYDSEDKKNNETSLPILRTI